MIREDIFRSCVTQVRREMPVGTKAPDMLDRKHVGLDRLVDTPGRRRTQPSEASSLPTTGRSLRPALAVRRASQETLSKASAGRPLIFRPRGSGRLTTPTSYSQCISASLAVFNCRASLGSLANSSASQPQRPRNSATDKRMLKSYSLHLSDGATNIAALIGRGFVVRLPSVAWPWLRAARDRCAKAGEGMLCCFGWYEDTWIYYPSQCIAPLMVITLAIVPVSVPGASVVSLTSRRHGQASNEGCHIVQSYIPVGSLVVVDQQTGQEDLPNRGIRSTD